MFSAGITVDFISFHFISFHFISFHFRWQNQRKLCGANSAAVDLLPPPGPGAEWTKDLTTDQSREADQVTTQKKKLSKKKTR